MASTLNRWSGIGRTGKDPVIKRTQQGVKLAEFSVATNDEWRDENGEKRQKTEWHTCTAWRKLADICEQYLRKGCLVYVEGKLVSSTWENQDKKKVTTWKIDLNSMSMLESRNKTQQTPTPYPEPSTSVPSELDIPLTTPDDDPVVF